MLRQRLGPRVDPLDPEPLVVLVDLDDARLSDRLDEAVQRDPPRRVHVHVVLVLDVLVVDCVGAHALRVVPALEQRHKVVLELARELGDRRARVRPDRDHLAQVRLAPAVRLEAVLVAALLLTDLALAEMSDYEAHLTVPLETTET